MTTYLTFQMRMRPLTRGLSSGRISYQKYIDGFDSVLKSIGWDEQSLLAEIDRNWEY